MMFSIVLIISQSLQETMGGDAQSLISEELRQASLQFLMQSAQENGLGSEGLFDSPDVVSFSIIADTRGSQSPLQLVCAAVASRYRTERIMASWAECLDGVMLRLRQHPMLGTKLGNRRIEILTAIPQSVC